MFYLQRLRRIHVQLPSHKRHLQGVLQGREYWCLGRNRHIHVPNRRYVKASANIKKVANTSAGVVALPFIGPACDTWGRRYGMMIGGAIASAGVIIQATSKPGDSAVGQFMGGRLLLGFGVPILTTAGPLHVIETAHPSHRGIITGLYNTFW